VRRQPVCLQVLELLLLGDLVARGPLAQLRYPFTRRRDAR